MIAAAMPDAHTPPLLYAFLPQAQLGVEPPAHDTAMGLGEACLEVTEEHRQRLKARQDRAAAQAAAAVAEADAAIALSEGRPPPPAAAAAITTGTNGGAAAEPDVGHAGSGDSTTGASAAAAAAYVERAGRGADLEQRVEALLASAIQRNPGEVSWR